MGPISLPSPPNSPASHSNPHLLGSCTNHFLCLKRAFPRLPHKLAPSVILGLSSHVVSSEGCSWPPQRKQFYLILLKTANNTIGQLRKTSRIIWFFFFKFLEIERKGEKRRGKVCVCVRERQTDRDRERQRHWFCCPLIYAFTGWFLYVPWPGMEPAILAYRDTTGLPQF